jgi:hypothetical protein
LAERLLVCKNDCAPWGLFKLASSIAKTNFFQTNNLATGRTELHLCATNTTRIERLVNAAQQAVFGRRACTEHNSTTGSVWKTCVHRTQQHNRQCLEDVRAQNTTAQQAVFGRRACTEHSSTTGSVWKTCVHRTQQHNTLTV